MVSSVSGSVDGWLWNGSPSLEIPQSDWEAFDGFNWSHDSELKVTKGELIPCGMWNGHPVYKNNEGGLLHMASDGYWSVADKLGNYGIRGLPGRLCPSESNLWEYWDGSKAQPAEILVINI